MIAEVAVLVASMSWVVDLPWKELMAMSTTDINQW